MRINPEEQYTFAQTHSIAEAAQLAENGENTPVAIGGRLMGIRDQGSILFGDIHDETGDIQIVADPNSTPEFEDLKTAKVGDWLGVHGAAGTTKRGQPSVFTTDWSRLAATEVGFPDRRSGLTDPETKARQRYLDLTVNPDSLRRFKARSAIVSGMRSLLEEQGFIEVETPILQPVHGGANARPFSTYHNALDTEMHLRIAPELYLKRLVVGGLERVYEIGKDFRNEGISTRHNPEFTMMEAYAAYWDCEDQMKLTEDLVRDLSMQLHGTDQIVYQNKEVDLSTPWRRATMDQLVSEAAGEELSLDTVQALKKMCKSQDLPINEGDGPGMMLSNLYEKLVESSLEGPIFVTDYPQEISPLARRHRSRPGYTERFEGIVAGRELCNGYTELNNAKEQYERFRDQESSDDDESMHMDHDYVRALQYGLPPTAGLGMGVDRLAMLLTDAPSIRDVILFPTMRPTDFKVDY